MSNGQNLITDLGIAKLTAAMGTGKAVAITHVALGDGNSQTYEPSPQATALRREIVRKPIQTQHMIDPKTWRIKAVFEADTPRFPVREIGFFDDAGDLISLWAGENIHPRETGAIDYALDLVLNFGQIADGLIIVDAPDDALFLMSLASAVAITNLQHEQLRQRFILRGSR